MNMKEVVLLTVIVLLPMLVVLVHLNPTLDEIRERREETNGPLRQHRAEERDSEGCHSGSEPWTTG